MRLLPIGTILGPLKLIGVCEIDDELRMLLCRSDSGIIYMGVLINEGPPSTWLYMSISDHVYKDLKNGIIHHMDVIREADEGSIYEVNVTNSMEPDQVGISSKELLSSVIELI